jgi:biotin carboxyl carrier protein
MATRGARARRRPVAGVTGPVVGDGVRARLAATSRVADEPELRIGVLAQRHRLVDGEPSDMLLRAAGDGRHVLEDGTGTIPVILEPPARDGRGIVRREVIVDGFRFEVEVESERRAALRERATRGRPDAATGGPHEVRALIPGKVVSLAVGTGDSVVAGQQLLVVEAMKMQNELRAPRDGTIEQLGVAQGVNIEVGDLLLVIG